MTLPVCVEIGSRLWAWAAAMRPLKYMLPLHTLVQLARRPARGRGRDPEFERRLERFLGAAGPFPRRPPGNCLERSLGAYRLLCAADAAPMLVIGLRKAESRIEGHVWVEVDGRALAEQPANLATYMPIFSFDHDGKQATGNASAELPAGVRFA